MNVLIINGARNPAGQTAQACAGLTAGLSHKGVTVEQVFLPTLDLERCRQCDLDGWGDCRRQGTCAIDDDLAGLVARIRRAVGVVFATPVYYGDLSESLRTFLERYRRTTWHAEEFRADLAGKPALGICVAGGGGGGALPCAVSLEKLLLTCHFDVLDMVCVRRQNLDLKVEVLAATGRWLAGQLISPV